MFDLTPEILWLVVTDDKKGLKSFLKKSGCIRVYRGGVRVFGLGGAGEDWLNLGGRRVILPQRRLSNNQIVGAVTLRPESIFRLKEQTNRRGFTENLAFQTFRKALLYVISQVEAERFKDKERIKAVLSGSKVTLPVLHEISKLKEAVRELGPAENAKLEPAVSMVENAYQKTKDMLVTAARSGLQHDCAHVDLMPLCINNLDESL